MNIGKRIKQRRKELGYSVGDLAAKIGKNRATVYRYENGDIKSYPTDVLEPLAKALKTTPAFLMGWLFEDSFWGRLDYLLFKYGIHESQMRDDLGLNYSEYGESRKTNTPLDNNSIYIITKYLNTTIEFLLHGEKTEERLPQKLQDLLDKFTYLDKTKQQILLSLLSTLYSQQEKENEAYMETEEYKKSIE